MKRLFFTTAILFFVFNVFAQGDGPGSGRSERGRQGPGRRLQMEKDSIISKINNLSADQQMLIEVIYGDLQTSVDTLVASARENPENFRSQMRVLNQEKNAQLKEILSEEQWTQYQTMVQEARERRGTRRGRGRGRRQQNGSGGGPQ